MDRALALSEPQAFEAIAGQGVMATVDDRQVLVGSARLLESYQVSLNGLRRR